MPDDLKREIMKKRKNILRAMKNYIDTELNSTKKNFYDQKEMTFKKLIVLKKCLIQFNFHKLSMK